jgi:conjugal transfer pilus assembly protein TraB
MIQRYWNELDPKRKRYVALIGGGIALISVLALFSSRPAHEKPEPRSGQDAIRHILTDRNTREIGIDSLSADVKLVSRENDILKKELDKLRRELERAQRGSGQSAEVDRALARLRQDITALTRKNKELAQKFDGSAHMAAEETKSVATETPADNQDQQQPLINQKLDYKNPADFFRDAPLPDLKADLPASMKGEGHDEPTPGIRIVSYSQITAADPLEAKEKADDSLYLPAGSILTGVLINGMDAPTAQGARRDPFPSTLRIQKEAILPNRFRADVRECFLIVSGYGDLSSERAYLRGETFSCVREDGGVIESRLDSYAVGEDGKAGVRGRVVSKQGQIIAKSMLAGFLSGVSDAFNVNPVPVLNTNPGARTAYQSVFAPQLLQGAAVKGASKALDRIARFYIDMAEGLFPVIEVDAGRQIDVIVTKGAKLQIRSTSTGGRDKK